MKTALSALGRRTAPPPAFDQVKDQLRQRMINEEVHAAITRAHADFKVERFNMDGSAIKATDGAAPPPAK